MLYKKRVLRTSHRVYSSLAYYRGCRGAQNDARLDGQIRMLPSGADIAGTVSYKGDATQSGYEHDRRSVSSKRPMRVKDAYKANRLINSRVTRFHSSEFYRWTLQLAVKSRC